MKTFAGWQVHRRDDGSWQWTTRRAAQRSRDPYDFPDIADDDP